LFIFRIFACSASPPILTTCYTPFRFNAVQREANAMKTAPQEKESRQNHPANIIAVRNSRNRKLRALWIRGTADTLVC